MSSSSGKKRHVTEKTELLEKSLEARITIEAPPSSSSADASAGRKNLKKSATNTTSSSSKSRSIKAPYSADSSERALLVQREGNSSPPIIASAAPTSTTTTVAAAAAAAAAAASSSSTAASSPKESGETARGSPKHTHSSSHKKQIALSSSSLPQAGDDEAEAETHASGHKHSSSKRHGKHKQPEEAPQTEKLIDLSDVSEVRKTISDILGKAVLSKVLWWLDPATNFNAQLVCKLWCSLLRSKQLCQSITISGMDNKIQHLHKAKYLGAATEVVVSHPFFISNAGLNSLCGLFSSIGSLRLAHCRNLTHVKFTDALSQVSRLESLDVSWTRLTDAATATLPDTLRLLSISTCEKLGDPTLAAIGRCCPMLQSLDFSFCHITDTGVCNLVGRASPFVDLIPGAQGSITTGRSLRHINAAHCKWISPGAFCTLVSSCPQLESIDLSCTVADDVVLRNLVEASSRKTFKLIRLQKCNHITDNGFSRLGVLHIDTLNVASTQVSCVGVTQLYARRPVIQSLDLSWTRVNDTILPKIFSTPEARSLLFLDVSYTKVSAVAVDEVREESPLMNRFCVIRAIGCSTNDRISRVKASIESQRGGPTSNLIVLDPAIVASPHSHKKRDKKKHDKRRSH
ncbi:hypothetical protein Pelo_7427 [Pelomyxa schiedti]|nr:hypothetical protein Pelo_7427 [Pelomyxa schiedti]